jgi:hypothetical protein
METVFLKKQPPGPARDHLDIVAYFAREHFALGYRTPQAVHDQYLNRQLAA